MLSPSPVWTQGMDAAILPLGVGGGFWEGEGLPVTIYAWILGVTIKKTKNKKQCTIKVLSHIVELWGMFAPTNCGRLHRSSF